MKEKNRGQKGLLVLAVNKSGKTFSFKGCASNDDYFNSMTFLDQLSKGLGAIYTYIT